MKSLLALTTYSSRGIYGPNYRMQSTKRQLLTHSSTTWIIKNPPTSSRVHWPTYSTRSPISMGTGLLNWPTNGPMSRYCTLRPFLWKFISRYLSETLYPPRRRDQPAWLFGRGENWSLPSPVTFTWLTVVILALFVEIEASVCNHLSYFGVTYPLIDAVIWKYSCPLVDGLTLRTAISISSLTRARETISYNLLFIS